MFLSKIWFILIALVSAVAGTFALVAPRPAVQKLAVLEGQRLDRAQYAAEQMFKVDAHKWIDRVSKLGRDAILVGVAGRRLARLGRVHGHSPHDPGSLPDADPRSGDRRHRRDRRARQQGARHRPRRRQQREGVRRLHRRRRGGGRRAPRVTSPTTSGAWAAGSSGSPARRCCRRARIGSSARSTSAPRRGPSLVERLKKNLDVDVALLLRGKVIASSRAARRAGRAPRAGRPARRRDRGAQAHARAAADVGQDKLLAVAAPFPGQAGEQQAYYALLGMQPAQDDRPRGAAVQRQLQRSQVGELPLGPARPR